MELNRTDRCDDKCSAAAYAVAEWKVTGHSLMFCGHHTRKHTEGLAASGAVIRVPSDESSELAEATAEHVEV